jgi:hypothetical protein
MKIENQLLARIAKLVTGKPEVEAVAPEAAAPAEVVEQAVEAAIDNAVELTVDSAVLADFASQLEAIKAEFEVEKASYHASLAEVSAKLEAAHAELAAIAAEKAELVATAAAAKLAARKEKIVAAIGTEKADALMVATGSLDDAAFEAVVSAMTGSMDAEAKSSLFTEVGVTAEADAAKVVEESAEMRILKKTYGAN